MPGPHPLADIAIPDHRKRPAFLNDDEAIIIEVPSLALLGIFYNLDQLRSLIRRGQFPTPIRLSERKAGWRLSTIKAWLKERERATKTSARRVAKG